jgi:hypothetical protein
MEQVTAQLNAFTKDGAESARILEMIRQRAALTPFAFEEMAKATASLMPAAKQSGTELEELVKLSEILAASNPAQGLEGAAFSLREALSGDFVSIVERFNLPRQRLNELKEQGVPALQAISQAMQEMGLDADLVSNLGQTAAGRWRTFKDTLVGLAAAATQPIFAAFSGELGNINGLLAQNAPWLEDMARRFGEMIGEYLPRAITLFYDFGTQLSETVGPAAELISDAWERIGAAMGLTNEQMDPGNILLAALGATLDAVIIGVELFAILMQSVAWNVEQVNKAVKIAISLYEQWSEITAAMTADNTPYTGAGMPGVPGGAPAAGASIPGMPGLVNLGRHADGGSFTVPGLSGGDQPFLIGLTPGEQVDVTPAGGGGQTSVSIPIQLDGQTIANYVLRLAGGRVVEMSRFGGTAAM